MNTQLITGSCPLHSCAAGGSRARSFHMLAEVYIIGTDMVNKTVVCRGTWEAEGPERQSSYAKIP